MNINLKNSIELNMNMRLDLTLCISITRPLDQPTHIMNNEYNVS